MLVLNLSTEIQMGKQIQVDAKDECLWGHKYESLVLMRHSGSITKKI